MRLNPEQKKLLKMFQQHKIKYREEPLLGGGVINPTTGKALKVTTLNINPHLQSQLNRLYIKGFISGKYLGLGHITTKGKDALKER
jgi:hypothetical protein